MVRLLSRPDLEQERAVVLLAMMEFLSEVIPWVVVPSGDVLYLLFLSLNWSV